MCGIVGYVGPREATPILVDGLKRLEYRGYDSCGIAFLDDHHIEVRKDIGTVDEVNSKENIRHPTPGNMTHFYRICICV